jgi:hypothetical protein
MEFEEIWNQLVRKSNALTNPAAKVEFTADNLKRLLRQVYEQGESQGVKIGTARGRSESASSSNSSGPVSGSFEDIFSSFTKGNNGL